MQTRKLPFFSPASLLVAVIFMTGLLLFIVFKGGTAFSPGPLTAKSQPGVVLAGYESHARFEQNCLLCHNPLVKSQSTLCLDCHQDVQEQVTAKTGLHGNLTAADRCAACHPDHQGKNFDPSLAAIKGFNHEFTRFSLVKHQLDYNKKAITCSNCHPDNNFKLKQDSCLACHATYKSDFMSRHVQAYGSDCLACHDGKDTLTHFDHQKAVFKLEGKHAQVQCESCHTGANTIAAFSSASAVCSDCHPEPDSHAGLFGKACQDCHTPSGWSPASINGQSFDHASKTGFSLQTHQKDYANNPMTCKSCHPIGLKQFDIQTCITCHTNHDSAFMSQHISNYGSKCLDCHDGTGKTSTFDHNKVFPLDGKHASLKCSDCHANNVFKGTPRNCSGCHQEPAVHAGVFGTECQNCHTTAGWLPANFNHQSSAAADCTSCHTRDKPANHYPGQCSTCHSTTAWKPAQFDHAAANATDCQSCHTKDKPANHYSGQCSACHTTTAWTPAHFDHAAANATDCQSCHTKDKPANHYPGQCSACHTTTAWTPAHFDHAAANATNCQSCHVRPAGHYPGQCSLCHQTSAWRPASFNHKGPAAADCQSCHARPQDHSPGQCSQCHNTTSWNSGGD